MNANLRTALLLGVIASRVAHLRRLAFAPAPAVAVAPKITTQGHEHVCLASHDRRDGEAVVNCLLQVGHTGFHAGVVPSIGRYTWAEPKPRACTCNCTVLRADVSQTASNWAWRIYDLGCDDKPRVFANGASEDLYEAEADITGVMVEMTAGNRMQMSEPVHVVTHHLTADVQMVRS